jgi:hypothetical protein
MWCQRRYWNLFHSSYTHPTAHTKTSKLQRCNDIAPHVMYFTCIHNILWHICWKPELWSQHRQPLLGNGSINTSIPRQWLSTCHMWQHKKCGKQCSLCSPWRGYIARMSCHTWKFTPLHTSILKTDATFTFEMQATSSTSTECKDPRDESTSHSSNTVQFDMWFLTLIMMSKALPT